jgi:hypothetical protein
MKVHITDWQKFEGEAVLSLWRRVGCNIEVQELYKLSDDAKEVAKFIDNLEKYKIFCLPLGVKRNIPGLINQTFKSQRRRFKKESKYYVAVMTTMRVAEWDKNRSEHEDFIPPHILH